MKERPIIFGGEMVQAILDGRKTQTRRVVKTKPLFPKCPYGEIGDRLWVRETWGYWGSIQTPEWVIYRADDDKAGVLWKSPIFMPRWASRITLQVTNIRCTMLQSISREDALCEGLSSFVSNLGHTRSDPRRIYKVLESDEGGYTNPIEAFENLWNSINAKRGYSWDSNPWVWVIEFERVTL